MIVCVCVSVCLPDVLGGGVGAFWGTLFRGNTKLEAIKRQDGANRMAPMVRAQMSHRLGTTPTPLFSLTVFSHLTESVYKVVSQKSPPSTNSSY